MNCLFCNLSFPEDILLEPKHYRAGDINFCSCRAEMFQYDSDTIQQRKTFWYKRKLVVVNYRFSLNKFHYSSFNLTKTIIRDGKQNVIDVLDGIVPFDKWKRMQKLMAFS